jgi:hypothetical protein
MNPRQDLDRVARRRCHPLPRQYKADRNHSWFASSAPMRPVVSENPPQCSKLLLRLRLIPCKEPELALVFGAVADSVGWTGRAGCNGEANVSLERYGPHGSIADVKPDASGNKAAVTLTYMGTCWAAGSIYLTGGEGPRSRRLPSNLKTLGFSERVSECAPHAKTCQLGAASAGGPPWLPSDTGSCVWCRRGQRRLDGAGWMQRRGECLA